MAQAPTPTTAHAARRKRWTDAWLRARKEHIYVWRSDDGFWHVHGKPYTLTVQGPHPQDVACTCTAGSFDAPCKHAIMVAYARKFGLIPTTPRDGLGLKTRCPLCFDLLENPLHVAYAEHPDSPHVRERLKP